jgi:hypothetical protein
MSTQITRETKVKTVAALTPREGDGQAVIPAGTVGVVREVYSDALGGYRVEFQLPKGAVVSAVLYEKQLTVVRGS